LPEPRPTLLLIEGLRDGRAAIHDLLSVVSGMLRIEHAESLAAALRQRRITDPAPSSSTSHYLSVVISQSSTPSRDTLPGAAIMVLAQPEDQVLARRAVDRGATDAVVTEGLDARTLWQLIALMFEHRGLQQQIFVERERAEITLNSIGDAVMSTDTQGRVTYLNREAEALTGWTAPRLLRVRLRTCSM
jgi:PAS domain-containing protein